MTAPVLVSGFHSVRAALSHGADSVLEVWLDVQRHDRRMRELEQRCRELGVTLHRVRRADLDQLLPGTNHQGVAARTRALTARGESDLERLLEHTPSPLLLVLDGVQDPHNLGAILRTAEAAGVHAVIAPKDRSVGLTPTVCRIASGGAETVPYIQVTNLVRTLQRLQQHYGIWVVGTAGEAATSLYGLDLRGSLALVMGGEEKGLRRLVRETCDQLVRLPMAGQVESLNVSVATGVSLFEAVRQRGAEQGS